MRARLVIILLLIAGAGYAYHSKYFTKLDARISFNRSAVMIRAAETQYTNCKVNLSGDYNSIVDLIRQDETRTIPFYDFKQWNGTILESAAQLDETVKVTVWCDQGRTSADFHNPK